SQKVAAEAHCSVRIGRHRRGSDDGPLKIIVAVDGSTDAKAAAQAVIARTWPAATEFRVMTVIDPRMETAVAWPDVYPDQWVQQPDEQAREWVCRMVEHLAKVLYDASLTVETFIFEGDPRHVLVREAESCQADCIFFGARGLQHGNRLFLGSTASGVAARAHCSVEIVR
ncbi:MAG TPA: universal stress protein, partial [Candidatus Eisenbacteria bacterium]|nr:universal stress protein [Candidatus Eisenbacteria bacterium]